MDTDTKVTLNFDATEATRRKFKAAAAAAGKALGEYLEQLLNQPTAVPADLLQALKTLDSRGGLGLDVHDWLRGVIAKAEGVDPKTGAVSSPKTPVEAK